MSTRARDETAAVRQRFVVLCTTLRGFANCAESYERLHHYLPAPDSVAAREIEAGGSLATDTLSFAAIMLGGAHDHVIGLENCSLHSPACIRRTRSHVPCLGELPAPGGCSIRPSMGGSVPVGCSRSGW
jgi:hypothetical protein